MILQVLDERLEAFNDRHLKEYLDDNLEPAPNKGFYICPYCGSGTGNNATGAFSYKAPGQGKHAMYTCFSCQKHGDIFNLVKDLQKLDSMSQAISYAYKVFDEVPPQGIGTKGQENKGNEILPWDNLTTDGKTTQGDSSTPKALTSEEYDIIAESADLVTVKNEREPAPELKSDEIKKWEQEYENECKNTLFTDEGRPGLDYLTGRGFSEKTIRNYNLGYDSQTQRIIIPWQYSYYHVSRSIDPKNKLRYLKLQGTGEPLFSTSKVKDGQIVFICEGQLDAISIEQGLRETPEINENLFNVFALGSTASKYIDPDPKNKANMLKKNSYYILALDNDEAGKKGAEAIYKNLTAHGYNVRYATWSDDAYSQNKDANDRLRTNEIYFKRDLKRMASDEMLRGINEYKATNYLDNLTARIKAGDVPQAISTGFKTLDSALGGGLYSGLYFLGAITSMGKTTLLLQIADQIASQGIPVFYYSLEMSASELIARSLTRYAYKVNPLTSNFLSTNTILHKDYREFDQGKKEQLDGAIVKYKADNVPDNIRFFEGVGNIKVSTLRKDAEQFYKLTGKAPVIFIDYLQILAPEEEDKRSTDKQIVDKTVLELKRLSRDIDTPIIAISSLNRTSYGEAISLTSFKESGAIEYGSDALLGLQPAGLVRHADTKAEMKYNAMIVKKCKDEDKERHVVVNVLKNRNGRTGRSALFNYNAIANAFDDKGIRWTDEEPGDVKEILKAKEESKKKELEDAIKFANMGQPATFKQIANYTGWTQKEVKKLVTQSGYTIDDKTGIVSKPKVTRL